MCWTLQHSHRSNHGALKDAERPLLSSETMQFAESAKIGLR